ncbi:hypothetical protein CRUP_020616, partial [Coryphaenoides rupestris]
KVRSTFLDMLLKVKAVRAAKFWDVCSMDHLLARLEHDSPPVCRRVVDLLFKSFFPVNESEKEWCCRCITLIQMNPRAARRFYQYASLHTAPTNIVLPTIVVLPSTVVKLMLSIRRVLNTCLPRQAELSQADLSQAELSQADLSQAELSHAELSQVEHRTPAWWPACSRFCWFCGGVSTRLLLQNKEAYQYTVAKFSSVISNCGVLSKLKQMGVCAGPLQFGQLLDCVCGWGRTSQVLELLTRWLSLDTPPDKAPDRRRVRIQEEVEAKPGLALSYLEYLLGRSSTREHLPPADPASLAQLHTTLGAWSEVLYSSLSSGAADRTDTRVQVALKAFTLQGRLAAHLHHASSPESRDFLCSLELSMAWLEERVLPYLSPPGPASQPGEGEGPGGHPGTLDLAKDIVEVNQQKLIPTVSVFQKRKQKRRVGN